MIKDSPEKNLENKRSKFLDRFEGRTSTISKAGLLSLLEPNIPQPKCIHNLIQLNIKILSNTLNPISFKEDKRIQS